MEASFTSGVGAVAKDVLLDFIVIRDGSGVDRERGTKLREGREGGREGGRGER